MIAPLSPQNAKLPTVVSRLAGSLLVAAAIAAPAQAADRPLAERPVPVLRVQGTGEQAAAPDTAILSFGVVREAPTAREALNANNAAMTAVIEAVKADGIEDRDIQTSGFSIQPRYAPRPRNAEQEPVVPRIVGYSVSNNLTLRVRDLSKVGALLDKVVTLGVNTGGNIAFTNADSSAIIASARAEAVKDARSRAETLAEAAGVKLGDILEINDSFTTPRPVGIERARMMAADAAMAVPVEAGQNTYSVTVQINWEILQ